MITASRKGGQRAHAPLMEMRSGRHSRAAPREQFMLPRDASASDACTIIPVNYLSTLTQQFRALAAGHEPHD